MLRELARLLASDDGTIVCIVDKTLEICGADSVPRRDPPRSAEISRDQPRVGTDSVPVERAIGNARVLTVGQVCARPTSADLG